MTNQAYCAVNASTDNHNFTVITDNIMLNPKQVFNISLARTF